MSAIGASAAATAAAMTQAVQRFVAALPAEQQAALRFPFDAPGRRDWHYTPGRRRGVSLAEMVREPAKAVHGLLTAAVSRPTHARVAAISGLEDVLDESEGGSRERHAGDYWTAVFGEPGADPWGWRFEGHHVSLHVTVAGDEVAGTPLFLGANPAEVSHGDRVVLRPLAEEEDTARMLLQSLPDNQRRKALIDNRAPDDILTFNSPRVEVDLEGGVAISDLTGEARAISDQLIDIHVDRVKLPVPADTADLHFAWAGSPERWKHHYYRLAGPRFLVEYDNTQNDANHAHSVWRDPANDFGDDLLRRHLAQDHTG